MSIEIVGKSFPIVGEGENLIETIKKEIDYRKEDILVISETMISRARGRVVELEEIEITDEAREVSRKTDKDLRICQLVVNEADKIVEVEKSFIVTELDGLVCANAGVDLSNAGEGKAILPLKKPHQVAEKYSEKLETGIVISDSVGRPFRKGAVGLAKAHSNLSPFASYVGKKDLFGREMETTKECVVDELASAANLVLGESDKGIPIAVIRNFEYDGKPEDGTINREPEKSVFR